ncbi:hypothetical protein C8J56DRAFT_966085 [Mycena floridula]|nr:hypothetical protein C8J56DRAFT_966085 [Mycena floridula]
MVSFQPFYFFILFQLGLSLERQEDVEGEKMTMGTLPADSFQNTVRVCFLASPCISLTTCWLAANLIKLRNY